MSRREFGLGTGDFVTVGGEPAELIDTPTDGPLFDLPNEDPPFDQVQLEWSEVDMSAAAGDEVLAALSGPCSRAREAVDELCTSSTGSDSIPDQLSGLDRSRVPILDIYEVVAVHGEGRGVCEHIAEQVTLVFEWMDDSYPNTETHHRSRLAERLDEWHDNLMETAKRNGCASPSGVMDVSMEFDRVLSAWSAGSDSQNHPQAMRAYVSTFRDEFPGDPVDLISTP
jgi:hypothetical protein